MNPDFKVMTRIFGTVVNVVDETDNSPARLQFFSKTNSGKFEFVDVKVANSKSSDLQKYLNKKVILNDVKVFQGDFNQKFYRVDDISLILVNDKDKN